jgi:hypothetical protein
MEEFSVVIMKRFRSNWFKSLRKVISHGPKFREPQHINWKHNFKIIMDAVEDYARRWIKREVEQDPELESLSDWHTNTILLEALSAGTITYLS